MNTERYVLHTDYATALWSNPRFIPVYKYAIPGNYEPGEVGRFVDAKIFLHPQAGRSFTVEDLELAVNWADGDDNSEIATILEGQ